ncbi:3'-5' exonuclease [Gulosibacter hominis]|uniref:3'-5' exonuclease n=1 Tax=Gulosibacter hominis TaxID=2770504 RepID=UPI001918067B|nr:3'-5' exonuclease [Gulosibacter hominis]
MPDFVALDFETANRSPASACAVGMVRVRGSEITDREHFLIRPPAGHDEFTPFNVQLHGISRERVSRAPEWPEALERILDFVGDDIIVAHNAGFDAGVLVAATRACALPVPAVRYFCSLRLARRGYQLQSYRLPNAAREAGYELQNHHDPLEDAEACAAIVIDIARRMEAATLAELSKQTAVFIREVPAEDADALTALERKATF